MADDATATEEVKLSKEEKAVIDALEKLNVVQVNNVVKFMEQEYGISAAAPVAVAVAGGGGDAGEAEAEKDSFDVELAEAGGQKIAVIKVVREITGLGLADAKGAVDSAPKVIKEGANKEEAEKIKKQLEEAGATVNLK
ncbi:MAG: 50S ribosomal protein L7/L12 [Candidatus Peribacteraceae bacterium]|nr:50S ribosomal protein L7/L12 [Candidatus Peribacteraceae bacterium]